MSNTKKTDRKNMTNQTITWPSADTYFTVESLLEKNSHIKQITLRVKLTKAINEGTIARLGTIHGGKGRPKVAYTATPVSDKALSAARNAEVLLDDKYSTVNVVNINSNNTETVEPTVKATVEKNTSHIVNA